MEQTHFNIFEAYVLGEGFDAIFENSQQREIKELGMKGRLHNNQNLAPLLSTSLNENMHFCLWSA
jgi:hypothetical protein